MEVMGTSGAVLLIAAILVGLFVYGWLSAGPLANFSGDKGL